MIVLVFMNASAVFLIAFIVISEVVAAGKKIKEKVSALDTTFLAQRAPESSDANSSSDAAYERNLPSQGTFLEKSHETIQHIRADLKDLSPRFKRTKAAESYGFRVPKPFRKSLQLSETCICVVENFACIGWTFP